MNSLLNILNKIIKCKKDPVKEEKDIVMFETTTLETSEENKVNYDSIKILIDNGHGEDTPGKRSPYSCCGVEPCIEFYEYKWAREIAKRISDDLLSMGYNVEIIVPEEEDIPLSERVRRVNNACEAYGRNNVILISIHANAAGNGDKWMSAKGWSAYTSIGNTGSDKLAEYFYNEAEKIFEGRKIRKDMQDGDRDWESNFYICQKTRCVAVLTENFFYDNVDDVEYILSEEGKNNVVKTHINGIINYINDIYNI